jgi:fumarate reductase flavoprotein subunit
MKQTDSDIVIVSGGTAGLAAAVAAAEKGANIIVFEKAATTGGTGNMAQGPFAVESRHQRNKGIALTKEEAFKIHMDFTHWRVDARLVQAYIEKSASTIEWLEHHGVEFLDVASHGMGFHFTWHLVKASNAGPFGHASAANMIRILTEKAKALGVRIFLQTPVKKIVKSMNRITGVIATDRSGEQIQANANAVIIATGGFGDNPAMLKKYTGYEWEKDIFSHRIPGLEGDGIRMAWEAGAAPTEMHAHMVQSVPGCSFAEAPMIAFTFMHPNLLVNLNGERFVNEEVFLNSTYFGNAIARQKNKYAFMIFDENTKNYYEETGFDFGPIARAANIDGEFRQALDLGNRHLFIADNLEELAIKTGINIDGLLETVSEYNVACDTGRDRLFYRRAKYLRSVKKPKFYAGKICPGILGTQGGIKINYKTEVLNKEQDVIQGLYAAGNDANSLYGDSYMFLMPGNTLGFAVNSGRIAGENAAEYIKSKA